MVVFESPLLWERGYSGWQGGCNRNCSRNVSWCCASSYWSWRGFCCFICRHLDTLVHKERTGSTKGKRGLYHAVARFAWSLGVATLESWTRCCQPRHQIRYVLSIGCKPAEGPTLRHTRTERCLLATFNYFPAFISNLSLFFQQH